MKCGLLRNRLRDLGKTDLGMQPGDRERAQLRPRCDRGLTFALVIVPCECLAEGSGRIALLHRCTLPRSLVLPRPHVDDLPPTMPSRLAESHGSVGVV